jgi:anti-sigma factor RsiW
MVCPDEDTIAQLIQGLLSGDERARLEQHLDGCAACTELVAELGKAFGPETKHSALPPPTARDTRSLTRIELFAALVHAVITLKLGWVVVSDGNPSTAPALSAVVVVAGVLFGPIGAAMATVAAWGSSRSAGWARRAAVVHALLALPSLALTPLAVYVLVHHRMPR